MLSTESTRSLFVRQGVYTNIFKFFPLDLTDKGTQFLTARWEEIFVAVILRGTRSLNLGWREKKERLFAGCGHIIKWNFTNI